MARLEGLMKLIGLTEKFRLIERIIYATGHPRHEGDAEHSFELALAAWYIISSNNLSLDADKAIRYALAHDLVEVYAGDTFFYNAEKGAAESKKKREEEARVRIMSEFPEFPELHSAIEEYERREDAESRFVYALDKVLPMIHVFNDGGKGWREKEITFELAYANKSEKVAASPEIKAYFDELAALLEKNKDSLFHKAS